MNRMEFKKNVMLSFVSNSGPYSSGEPGNGGGVRQDVRLQPVLLLPHHQRVPERLRHHPRPGRLQGR